MADLIIDLGPADRKFAESTIWATRGRAIQHFADLEQSLCRIFSRLSGVSDEIGGLIFFRFSTVENRLIVLGKLFKKKFLGEYTKFRDTLIEFVKKLNKQRNYIVHWNLNNIMYVNEEGIECQKFILTPPQTYGDPDKAESFDENQMIEFNEKCFFITRLCNLFDLHALSSNQFMPETEQDSLRDIFSQAIVYPPPAGHPLSISPTGGTPETPPQS